MAASPDKSLPEYALSEVQQHESPDDLWMILYNKVYDFTTLPKMHPGGAEVLFDCGGVDATEAFEDVGHSKNACDMLSPFLIGKLPEDEEKCYKQTTHDKSAPTATKEYQSKPVKRENSVAKLALLALLACVAILGLQRLKWANIAS